MGLPRRNASPEETRRLELRTIMLMHDVKTEKQAEVIRLQQEAVLAIDETVDLEPLQTPVAIRKYERLKPLTCSAIWPGRLRTHEESSMSRPTRIDRDCDQVRLMIRRFCYCEDPETMYDWNENKFSIDQLQTALGVQRFQMTTFLEKKGPKEGAGTNIYHLAGNASKSGSCWVILFGKVEMKAHWTKTISTIGAKSVGSMKKSSRWTWEW